MEHNKGECPVGIQKGFKSTSIYIGNPDSKPLFKKTRDAAVPDLIHPLWHTSM